MDESRRAERQRPRHPLTPEARMELALLLGHHFRGVSDSEVPRIVASKLVARERVDVINILVDHADVDLANVRELCVRYNVADELDALVPAIEEERRALA